MVTTLNKKALWEENDGDHAEKKVLWGENDDDHAEWKCVV